MTFKLLFSCGICYLKTVKRIVSCTFIWSIVCSASSSFKPKKEPSSTSSNLLPLHNIHLSCCRSWSFFFFFCWDSLISNPQQAAAPLIHNSQLRLRQAWLSLPAGESKRWRKKKASAPLTELQRNSSLYIRNAHGVKGQRARGESTRAQAGKTYLNKPGMPGWLEAAAAEEEAWGTFVPLNRGVTSERIKQTLLNIKCVLWLNKLLNLIKIFFFFFFAHTLTCQNRSWFLLLTEHPEHVWKWCKSPWHKLWRCKVNRIRHKPVALASAALKYILTSMQILKPRLLFFRLFATFPHRLKNVVSVKSKSLKVYF